MEEKYNILFTKLKNGVFYVENKLEEESSTWLQENFGVCKVIGLDANYNLERESVGEFNYAILTQRNLYEIAKSVEVEGNLVWENAWYVYIDETDYMLMSRLEVFKNFID